MLVRRLWARDPDCPFNYCQLLNEKCYAHSSSLGRVHLRNSQGYAGPGDRTGPRHANFDHSHDSGFAARTAIDRVGFLFCRARVVPAIEVRRSACARRQQFAA